LHSGKRFGRSSVVKRTEPSANSKGQLSLYCTGWGVLRFDNRIGERNLGQGNVGPIKSKGAKPEFVLGLAAFDTRRVTKDFLTTRG